MKLLCLIQIVTFSAVHCLHKDPFLPPDHLPYFESLVDQNREVCWGHEDYCEFENSFSKSVASCQPGHKAREYLADFFKEADFGYLGQKLKTLSHLCQPEKEGDSELLCTKDLQFCTGRRLMVDFSDIPRRSNVHMQYDMNVLKYGQIGAKCRVSQDFIASNLGHMSPLQSWAPEMRNFAPSDLKCDVTVDKPTFIVKLDATVNMYHHFCDFFNLYSSLLINATLDPWSAFSRDVHYLVWENQPYKSSIQPVFNVFTQHPIWNLDTFAGRKVCFEKIVFPLLPRMIFGLFYNTPFSSYSCARSGLFKAFSEFVAYRMGVRLPVQTSRRRIKVTILNRLTPHRNIANLKDLVTVLEQNGRFDVTVANFTHWGPAFKRQMEIVRRTDVLVGIHGAGLAHMLFLPDWAVVFELYHCDDPDCYRDLARLKGLKHITWTDDTAMEMVPSEKAHFDVGTARAKFTHYKFHPEEFLRKMEEAESHLLNHPEFTKLDTSDKTRHEL